MKRHSIDHWWFLQQLLTTHSRKCFSAADECVCGPSESVLTVTRLSLYTHVSVPIMTLTVCGRQAYGTVEAEHDGKLVGHCS